MAAHYNKQGFRGRWLEDVIENTNHMYAHRNIALISKIPTPTQVARRNGQIVGARYTSKSIVDFEGIYHNGQHIAFDTKECQKTNFPFSSVLPHQIDHLKKVKALNGLAFILIYFRNHDELYLLHIDEFIQLLSELKRKSIPYSYFKDNKKAIVKQKNGYYFDYLNAGDLNKEE